MWSFFEKLLDTADFPARWNCGKWSAELGWLHIGSDLAIFGAYTAIPVVLAYFLQKRRDIPFMPVMWLFVLFIFSCGLGHFLEATLFWHPWYRLAGVVKLVTACASWATVFALIPIVPSVLHFPKLAAVNDRLEREMIERTNLEADLRRLNEELESRVQQRTLELEQQRQAALKLADEATAARRFAEEQRHKLEQLNNELAQEAEQRAETQRELENSYMFLNSIVEHVPTMLFVKEAAHLRFERLNRAGEELLGIAEEEMLGKNDYDMFPLEQADFFVVNDRRVLASNVIVDIPEETIQSAHGTRILHTRKIPILNAQGEATHLLGISEDITERKRAEDELTRRTQELSRSNAELEQFAYIASHDLQEPLRKVQAFGDMLRTRFLAVLGAEGIDYLQRMQSASSRMQSLINELLSYSRVTTKGRPFVQVNLEEIATQVLSDLEGRLQQTQGVVTIDHLPTLMADPLQMRQLMQNLIGNALKFHRRQVPPVIRVCSQTLLQNAAELAGQNGVAYCEIRVVDNGIGFETKYVDRIFNPFQRLHGRSEYEGTGMGLAICRKIVERHGGTITAESVPNEGSTFVVTLPLLEPYTEVIDGTEPGTH